MLLVVFLNKNGFAVKDFKPVLPQWTKRWITALVMELVRVTQLQALAESHFSGNFVKLADDWASIEIVISHNGMNLLAFCRGGVCQRRDKHSGFALPPQSLSVQMCCRN